jgi:hypothetical protein
MLPGRKVSVQAVAGAIVTIGFYVAVTWFKVPDPPAAVGAAAVWIVGTVLAYIIPEKDQTT